MANSYIDYTGDGETTDFTYNKGYINKSHVFLSVDGTDVSFTWVNANLIRADVAPTLDSEVRAYRVTPKEPLVTFSDTNNLTAANLTIAETQTLYVALEAEDRSNEAKDAADGTVETSELALVTSQEAEATADSAETKANTAVSTANAAQTATEGVLTAAQAAQTAAEEAQDAATTLAATVGIENAADLEYDNTSSGLTATNTQAAIDEIAAATGAVTPGTDVIDNQSSVAGLKLSDALDNLAGDIADNALEISNNDTDIAANATAISTLDGAAAKKAANLSDLADVNVAKTNLGLHAVASSGEFSAIENKPTTLAGYGITDAEPKGKLSNRLTKTADHTLVVADAGALIEMEVATANTLTIPLSATADLGENARLDVVQTGAGVTSIAIEAGGTLNGGTDAVDLSAQYTAVTIYRRGTTDAWVALGSLAAAA